MKKPKILVCGILDTKGKEIQYLKERVIACGGEARILEISVGNEVGWADIPLGAVLAELGKKPSDITSLSRDKACDMVVEGAQKLVKKMYEAGDADGIIGYGGSMGASITTAIMQELPIGFPKLMLTTMASGDIRPYIGTKDIAMMYPIAEAGLNSVTRQVLSRAAGGIVGMCNAAMPEEKEKKQLVGCMMFGVTTPCVLEACSYFEKKDEFDIIINHAVGTGGRSMEEMIDDGFICGMLDITTHELADERFGGVLPAGPNRLTAAARMGIPQVVSPGGMEILNFGPKDTVPERHMSKTHLPGKGLYVHNPNITCVGTSPDECRELAKEIGEKLSKATAPTSIFVPMRGWSATDLKEPNKDLGWSGPGAGPCWVEDESHPGWSLRSTEFLDELKKHLDTSKDNIEIVVADLHLNQPEFGRLMAQVLEDMLKGTYKKGKYANLDFIVETR
ncbi:Tm-1-like ATP-binding domain-containing protein [Desulfovibrio sp. OttesenSCG-928-O18]|nr:Tm-1-like ATP-binding domain-containing protein [Desulfovibrio sp. OttesenSCG-928-O18]